MSYFFTALIGTLIGYVVGGWIDANQYMSSGIGFVISSLLWVCIKTGAVGEFFEALGDIID